MERSTLFKPDNPKEGVMEMPQSVAQSVARRLAPNRNLGVYTWQDLASEALSQNPGQTYLIWLDDRPAFTMSDHSAMSTTVMAYQRAGKSVCIQVILDDPTEDELHAAGFAF
jgi:hypothetical protein